MMVQEEMLQSLMVVSIDYLQPNRLEKSQQMRLVMISLELEWKAVL